MRLILEKSGNLITLGDTPVASGGEASLYVVPNMEWLIAKIYHRPTPLMAEKLTAMIANPPTDPMASRGHPSIAWPADRLLSTESHRQCVGYVMPHVTGMRSIFEFYNPKTRRKQCPLYNYRYLIRTARNLAAAFSALHSRGYVLGDVNESNCLVSETALVTLVDTDSFQVTAGEHVFRCPVGKPEFTPPELQGVHFREVDRKPEHDAFGLAVLVFLLLMEGTHPFAGRSTEGAASASIAEAITRGYFSYGIGRLIPYEPMPLAPPIGILHPDVRALMRRCFETGHLHPSERPDADAWQTALDRAERELTVCRVNNQHLYRLGIGACPWCERMQRLGGRDPFPSKDAVRRGEHLAPVRPTPPQEPPQTTATPPPDPSALRNTK